MLFMSNFWLFGYYYSRYKKEKNKNYYAKKYHLKLIY